MSPEFKQCVSRVKGVEGDYSNNKSDRGGKTRFGITEAVARKHGYVGLMSELPWAVAEQIYFVDYWDKLNLESVSKLSHGIAEEMFDTGVNCGIGNAGEFLQRALNSLNRQAVDYPDLKVDGGVGPATVAALNAFLKLRGAKGELVMLRALNSQQGVYYMECGENRPANEDFMFGWLLQRVA